MNCATPKDEDTHRLPISEALSILEDEEIEWLVDLGSETFQGRKGEVSYFINGDQRGVTVCIISEEREVSKIIRRDEETKQRGLALFKAIKLKYFS